MGEIELHIKDTYIELSMLSLLSMETKFTELLSKLTACKQRLVNEIPLHALLTSLFPLTTEKAHIAPLPTTE